MALHVVDATSPLPADTLVQLQLCKSLGITHIITCLNKLDIVDFAPTAISTTTDALSSLMKRLGLEGPFVACCAFGRGVGWGDGVGGTMSVLEALGSCEIFSLDL